MITDKPNMGREQIFTELPLPSKVKEVTLELIYKALFIIVKLLLDSRLNLVKISEGELIKTKHKKFQQGRGQRPEIKKPDNPIKGLDSIKIEDKPVAKVDDSTVEKTAGEGLTKTEETKDETQKSDEATNDTNKPSEG